MLKTLQTLNPGITILDINNKEFEKYGRILKIDASDIISEASKLHFPESGTQYIPSVESLEQAYDFKEEFGFMDIQTGICHGFNSKMSALEYHKSSELNIAVSDLILILGRIYDMEENEYQSENVKAFFLKKGDAVELYSTTMHFCPCQTDKNGFSCIVVLPKFTNEVLESLSEDKLIFKKNKWIICHDENTALISKGVYPGIHGIDYEIKYN